MPRKKSQRTLDTERVASLKALRKFFATLQYHIYPLKKQLHAKRWSRFDFVAVNKNNPQYFLVVQADCELAATIRPYNAPALYGQLRLKLDVLRTKTGIRATWCKQIPLDRKMKSGRRKIYLLKHFLDEKSQKEFEANADRLLCDVDDQ
jgi:hypothetical protein